MQVSWKAQEEPNGCLVACAAMIMGLSYRETDAMLRRDGYRDPDGTMRQEHGLECWLAEQGVALQKLWIYGPGSRRREPWPPLPWAHFHLCNVHVTQNYHGVIMLRDGTVLDPLGPEPRRLSDYRAVNSVAAVYWIGDAPASPATGPTADEIRALRESEE
jgi:hypothetical protein